MMAMVLRELCEIDTGMEIQKEKGLPFKKNPLDLIDVPSPIPGSGEIIVKVNRCGVCHTELDEIEGRLVPPVLPLIPGHEVIGRVESVGEGVQKHGIGDRVGIAWINSSCNNCGFCKKGLENLCSHFKATGLDANGGYGQYIAVSEEFAYPIPEIFSDAQAAPLLCAGIIGYRALKLTGAARGDILGLYGFGASAHITIQIAKYWGCKVFVFTRKGSDNHRDLALKLGADWVGATEEQPPDKLNYAIDFTPIGEPVRQALNNLEKGGRVVINAIRKTVPIPELDYAKYLWHEKEIKSVANVTRQDALEFLPLAAEIGISPEINEYDLEEANLVLRLLKKGEIQGAAVLRIPHDS